ncbi:MAG: EamA family transporter RarD [Sphingomonadales bacterium]|nr:EamA family transporter RarD [Sphingomonadales bacterium]
MSEAKKGFWAIVAACVIWGLSGLYYKVLSEVPPIEVLAHRTLWSAVFLAAVLGLRGRLGELVQALGGGRAVLGRLVISALVISTNWFAFIWSVQQGHALEASFGYYIFPLVAVLLGRLVLGEAMGRLQWVAVGLAGFAVLLLGAGLGVTPWVPLILAVTFGSYGLIKKQLAVAPVTSVLAEVVLLAPVAVGVLWATHLGALGDGQGGQFGRDPGHSLMLAFSGVLTGGPLILFSYAAQRVRLATMGLVQYLNPTLQLGVAVLAFGEPLTPWHLMALPLIWVALALYSGASLRRDPVPPPAQ